MSLVSPIVRKWRHEFPEDAELDDVPTMFHRVGLQPPASLTDSQAMHDALTELTKRKRQIMILINYVSDTLESVEESEASSLKMRRSPVPFGSNLDILKGALRESPGLEIFNELNDETETVGSLDEYLENDDLGELDQKITIRKNDARLMQDDRMHSSAARALLRTSSDVDSPSSCFNEREIDIRRVKFQADVNNDDLDVSSGATADVEEDVTSDYVPMRCIRQRKKQQKTVHERLSLLDQDDSPSESPPPRSTPKKVNFNIESERLSTYSLDLDSTYSTMNDSPDIGGIKKSTSAEDLHSPDRRWELNHILADEKRHMEILNLLCKYCNALKSKVPSESVDVIFYKVEKLYQDQLEFVTSLMLRLQDWTDTTSIADLMEKLLEHQTTIQDYALNIPKAVKTLDEILISHANYASAVEVVKVEGKDVRLRDVIQQPAIWLTKTAENFKRIVAKTPEGHADFVPLQNIQNMIRQKLVEKKGDLGKSLGGSDTDLSSVNRILQRNSLMVELGPNNTRKLRHVFLFTDLLVCAKQKLIAMEMESPNPVNKCCSNESLASIDAKDGAGHGQCSTSSVQHKVSSFEVKWFIPITTMVLYKANDYETEEVKSKRRQEIENTKQKIKQLKLELKKEIKEAASGKEIHGRQATTRKDMQFSFRKWIGPKRQTEKLKEQLVKLQGSLVLLSPNLKLCVGQGSDRVRTLLMSSENERATWRESIQTLRAREQTRMPTNFSTADVNHMLDQFKDMVVVNNIGSYLLSDDDEGVLTGVMNTQIHRAEGLNISNDDSMSNYHVCIDIDSFEHFDRVAKTTQVLTKSDAIWNESFDIELDSSQVARFMLYRDSSVMAQLDLKLDLESLDDYKEKTHVVRTMESEAKQILLTVSLSYTARYQTLVRQPSMWKEGLFGVPLSKVVKREDLRNQSKDGLPLIIKLCVEEIEKRGLQEQGIYRVSGSSYDVADLKKAFEKKVSSAAQSLPKQDINVVAGVLKSYLRELPDPVLIGTNYPVFMAAIEIPSADDREKALKHLITTLPEPNLATFKYLVKHFVKVSSFNSTNRMVVGNLGLIFGPTLLCPSTNSLPQDILSVTLESMKQAKTLTQIIILVREGKLFPS